MLEPLTLGGHSSGTPGRAVPTSRIRCPGTASASAEKSARPSSGAKWRSSIRTTVGRSAASARVAWTNTVCSESLASGSRPAGGGSPRSSAANAGTRSGVAGGSARGLLETLLAELLAERRRERARRRRRPARRVGAEEDVDVLPLLLEPPDELVHEPRLPDARLALDQHDPALAGLRRAQSARSFASSASRP